MSTWGSLRLRLQKQFPGADIDLIDSALNERYEQVLEACNWTGTTYHTTLQTIAAYQSGQQGMNPQPGEDAADLMVGNAIVNIINTPGQNPVVGMKFYVPGDTVIYTIVAVSLGATAGAITGASVGAGGSSFLLNQILNVVQGTATGGQVQVSALGANGSVAAVTIYAGGVQFSVANGLPVTSAAGATITILSVNGSGGITGSIVDAGGTGPYLPGQVLAIVQAGASGGTAIVASVDENGVVIGTTPGAPGVGYSVAPNLPTTSGNGCTINITAVSMISLTLDRPYEGNGVDPQGTGYLAYPYVYMQNVYTLPIDVATVTSILDPVTGIPLTPFSKDNLDESVGPRTLVQNPNGWAIYDDTNETAPPTQHQVELYPPPLYARGFPVEYTHAAIGFDGVTTTAAPMGWITDSVLLAGCRADLSLYLAGLAATPAQAGVYIKQSSGYNAQWLSELGKLLLTEHMQRRAKTSLKVAPRYTRHRLARAARDFNSSWRGGQIGGPN